ncbi:MAG TPA: hypothetical protein VFF06_22955 [Polyangia bacterium]|nr:hypothetical protein [Polyangia bacterium]
MTWARARVGWVVGAAVAAACGPSAAPPLLYAVAPARVCGSGAIALVLSGARFTPLPSSVLTDRPTLDVPRAIFQPRAAAASAPLELADDANGTPVRWISAAELDVTLPLDGLALGAYDVSVENPDGARATLASALSLLSGGVLAIESVAPPSFCNTAADQTVTLTGRGFRAGTTVAIVDGNGATQLAPAPAIAGATLTFVVPKSSLAPGDYQVRLQSPPDADCVSTAQIALTISPGPRVDSITPAQICAPGGALDVSGAGFVAGATAGLRDAAANQSLAAMSVTVHSATSATVQFGAAGMLMKNAQLDFDWRNPDGCAFTLAQAVRLKPGGGGCP